MLNDKRIAKLVDFENSSEIFPGVSVAGGICYFLWDKEFSGPCEITSINKDNKDISIRYLNEYHIFIRKSKAISIIRKIIKNNERMMNEQVLPYKPFGLRTYEKPQKKGDILLYWHKGIGPYKRSDIKTGADLIDKYKVISSRSGHEHAGNPNNDGKRRVLSKIEILPPGTICTETYLVVGVYTSDNQAKNLVSYMKTKLFRFLLSLSMYSHSITKDTYSFIPILDMNTPWTDEILYRKYKLNDEEVLFIESTILPME